jgi:hypothetical protein
VNEFAVARDGPKPTVFEHRLHILQQLEPRRVPGFHNFDPHGSAPHGGRNLRYHLALQETPEQHQDDHT